MAERQSGDGNKEKSGTEKGKIQASSINLSKGGGAIRGIEEKYSVNPVTGSASFSIPIFTSPGRSDFSPKLATMFNPVGAIVQAALAIYNTIMFFIERAKQIAAVVQAVFNSISPIAYGRISKAANWIEKTMARTIPVILGFLARLIGLGGMSSKMKFAAGMNMAKLKAKAQIQQIWFELKSTKPA